MSTFTASSETTKLVDNFWRKDIQETDEFTDSFWMMMQNHPTENANVAKTKVKVRTAYNASETTGGADGAAYADGDSSSFQNFYVPYRFINKTCLYTKEALDNDDGKSQYHPALEELASARLVGMKSLNRHALLGDGLGTIGITSAVESGSTVTCAPNTTFGNKGAQFVRPGAKVQIYDATGATQRTGGSADVLTVSSVVLSTGVITFSTAAPTDVISTDIIVNKNSVLKGVNGLEYWVASSGSLFELSRATYPGLQSTMVDGSSGSLLLLVEKMFAKSAFKTGANAALGLKGSAQRKGWWSPTQRQAYRQDSLGLGITMLGSPKLDAGYAHKEEINGHTFTCEPDHSNTKIHFLMEGDWRRIVRGTAEKPYEIVKVHGQSVYNTYDSDNNPTSTLATTIGGYVNVSCINVRNQAAIYSLPTSGLETGN